MKIELIECFKISFSTCCAITKFAIAKALKSKMLCKGTNTAKSTNGAIYQALMTVNDNKNRIQKIATFGRKFCNDSCLFFQLQNTKNRNGIATKIRLNTAPPVGCSDVGIKKLNQ